MTCFSSCVSLFVCAGGRAGVRVYACVCMRACVCVGGGGGGVCTLLAFQATRA